jgi:hypothetical protein
MPSNTCGLYLSNLGCMQERRPLSTLLHQYWSRSPYFLPVPRLRLLHYNRHPCSVAGYSQGVRAYVNPQTLLQP